MKNIILLLALGTAIFSCKKNNDTYTPSCSGATPSFANEVKPLLVSSCSSGSKCHGSGSHEGCGELLTYSDVSGSKSSVRQDIATGRMPQNGSLTDAQKNVILCWIDAGAPNN